MQKPKPKPKADKVPEKKAPEKKALKQQKKDSTIWQDELGTELAAYGLRVKQVVGDGNCFFRAVTPRRRPWQDFACCDTAVMLNRESGPSGGRPTGEIA